MLPPSPDARRIGRRLLELEAGGRAEPEDLADAAERAARKLGPHLGRLVGAAGYHVLLKRALHLASRESAFLAPVRTPTADGGLDGLRAAVHGVEPERARAAVADVLGQLAALLVTFIGPGLTLRALRQVWPEVELDQGDSDPEEAPA